MSSTSPSLHSFDWPASALDEAQRAFDYLVAAPAPLALDCRALDPGLGFPTRHIALDELRQLLLDRATTSAARDAVWSLLCTAAQSWGPQWLIGVIGIALPGLKAAARQLCVDYTGDRGDIDAEILTGFLTALCAADPADHQLAARLIRAGRYAGKRLRQAEERYEKIRTGSGDSRTPPPLYGHPDLLLGRAVALNVISEEQAQLIYSTRLEERRIDDVAARFGQPTQALRMQRRRAEHRLADAVRQGLLSGL